MNQKSSNDEFKIELLALMERYNVEIVESEQYDGAENYVGSTFRFSSKDGGQVFLDIRDMSRLWGY
jgi:hypothetical protein